MTVWREKRGEFPYYNPSWVARTHGWALTVQESIKGFSYTERSGWFGFFANHKDGRVFNSWGEENSKRAWRSHEAAQAAAEAWAANPEGAK